MVPTDAKYISLVAQLASPTYGGFTVSLNGIDIPVVATSTGRWEGDISAFSGKVATLTFSVMSPPSGSFLDDIQFEPVPEPTQIGLLTIGIVTLWLMRRNQPNTSLEPTAVSRSD